MKIYLVWKIDRGYYSSRSLVYVGLDREEAKKHIKEWYDPYREAVECEVWIDNAHMAEYVSPWEE